MGKVNLGGDRLGSGNKMDVTFHGYERSNHDLSYMWKNTQAPGTLVPFMSMIALPGDSFDIKLDSIVKTLPTIGPMFGSFKLQLDVFQVPIRLYNKKMHNNKLGVGLDIQSIKFPLMTLRGLPINKASDIPMEFQQINQSSLLAYLGMRGVGGAVFPGNTHFERNVNAIPYLAYFDIFKNYYANKMEENAYVIHGNYPQVYNVTLDGGATPIDITSTTQLINISGINITKANTVLTFDLINYPVEEVAIEGSLYYEPSGQLISLRPKEEFIGRELQGGTASTSNLTEITPRLFPFPLINLDTMRESILENTSPIFIINENSPYPYNLPLIETAPNSHIMSSIQGQEGLLVKTYQSDIFNNWLQTELIEGEGSIAQITAISTTDDYFTLDTLNLSKKVYDLLNRVAVSGGSLEDYIEAAYDHKSKWRAETPIYLGGLSKEIVFQEVVSTAATKDEPVGTLAGKGIMSQKHKGGHIYVTIDEPSYLMGIVSITPRLDYSQGNNWDMFLETLDDLHKPALDGIGFQDLITEQMAFWDSFENANSWGQQSAGKQPAWLNYMTNFNKSYGNFADPRSQMFMTLNRRYESVVTDPTIHITDLTTYIDPAKFNYAFAQIDLSSMNFWVQIGCDIEARRKLSAAVMPNL